MLKNTLTLAALFSGLGVTANAATVTMTAGDGFGASSFNSAGSWSPSAAPSSGNDYFNGGFLLRTPNATNASFAFAGDSLTITGAGNFAVANNEALMWKGNGTGAVITVSNLIVNGGQIRHGDGTNNSFTLAGNISIGASGAGIATQGGMFITAPISGSSTITVMDNGSGEAGRTVFFQSPDSTFSGNLVLNAARSRATFNNGGVFNFSIGANGVNNSISNAGVLTLDGLFKINADSADLNPGNTWSLITGTAATYGSNFAVDGFTASGSTWTNASNTLAFDTTTGVVTALAAIPEPSSFAALAGLAVLGLGASRRRRA